MVNAIHCVLTVLLCWDGGANPAAGIRRVYVEPFPPKAGAAQLRAGLVAQLRRAGTIEVVADRSKAEAVLVGSGEIWVRGYVSLNPRAGHSLSNAAPTYSGFLSVELKDLKGETLWSYLAPPGGASENMITDLTKRVVKRLAEAVAPARAGH